MEKWNIGDTAELITNCFEDSGLHSGDKGIVKDVIEHMLGTDIRVYFEDKDDESWCPAEEFIKII